jgi:4-amino-4-deoxy-L-arabinose transferase-like glycosyltransferase
MLSEQAKYARRAWWLLAGIALIRIIYVLLFPFDLSGDEAYYWDWGRQLAWGYFSKPPFIAWLMAFSGWLGGNTDSGIRLMAVALGTGSLIFVYLLTRQLWNNKAAFWAVLLTAASPGGVTINLILTIDAPLMFFWSGALYFFYNQIHNRDYQKTWMLLGMLFIGLGLLSKQMMFAFFPLAIIYLLINAEQRHRLKDWRMWFCWLLAISFLVPTLVWNAHNEWITIIHTQHHFNGKPFGLLEVLTRTCDFFLSQLLMISLVTGIAVVFLLINGIQRFRSLDFRARYLLIFSAPGLLVICLMLIHQSINPNWPAVFYTSILILLAGAISGEQSLSLRWQKIWPRWRYAIAVTGIAFTLFFMATPFILEWKGLTGSKYDPVVRLEGWTDLAKAVQRVRETHSSQLNEPFLIATGHRYTVSHLAFYLIDQPRVYHWPNNPGTIESQYELWGFPDNLEGRDAFIIVPGEHAEAPESISHVFDSIELLDPQEQIAITRSAKRTRYYTLYIGKRLKLSSSVSETTP